MILFFLCLSCLGAGSCTAPGQRGKRLSPSPGPWEKVGRRLGRDLAENFRDPQVLLVRPLSWRGTSPADRTALTKVLAEALAGATGWKVLLEGSGRSPFPGPLVEVQGRVERQGWLPGEAGKEVVEFTVRLAGEERGRGRPWTAWYALDQACSGFT